jgi:predicted Holliday junction resolvase-like endonuclease
VKNGNGNLLMQLTKSTIVSIFVIVLLSFLFCSSLYLVFRIDSLQKQVESQGQHILSTPNKDIGGMLHTQNWNDLVSAEHSEKMQKVLDSSVDQIAGVRKSLEGLASLVRDDNKKDDET